MHRTISFNRDLTTPAEARMGCVSAAALYGRGIFTTIAVYDGVPFLWEKHWRRVRDNALKVGIDISNHPENAAREALSGLLEANKVKDGRARITFFDGSPSGVWPSSDPGGTGLLITTADPRAEVVSLKLTTSPFTTNSSSPLAGVKSCNYMENILAREEAERRGFAEAILLNERGWVTSGCMSNVFWTEGGKLFTPPLRTGCIAGTTREFVMENLECCEADTSIESLRKADAIFLTSAGIGVQRVAEIDGRVLAQSDHPILSLAGKN
jgi:branched-chain amino acid aminotransferase